MKNRLKIMEGTGDYMNKNQNIRFNMDKESDIMAWESLHSKDVGERFKSQNRFVIEAINYYYERVMRMTMVGSLLAAIQTGGGAMSVMNKADAAMETGTKSISDEESEDYEEDETLVQSALRWMIND